jgi:hypothetical protein
MGANIVMGNTASTVAVKRSKRLDLQDQREAAAREERAERAELLEFFADGDLDRCRGRMLADCSLAELREGKERIEKRSRGSN